MRKSYLRLLVVVLVVSLVALAGLGSSLFASQSPTDARTVINQYLGDNSIDKDYKIVSTMKNQDGQTVVKLQQLYNGIPVFGSTQKALVNKNGEIQGFSVDKFPVLERGINVNLEERISQDNAIKKAETDLGFNPVYSDLKPNAQKVLYNINKKPLLVYYVSLSFESPKPGNWRYFIDAITGKVVDKYNMMSTVMGTNDINTGMGVLGDTKTFDVTKSDADGKYYLQDNTRGKGIITYDAKSSNSNGSETSDPDGNWIDKNQKAMVDAQKYAGVTYDFYKEKFGRNSFDDKGAIIKSTVHYGSKFNNAGWTGSRMIYGDGDGKTFVELSGGLDVIGHELTHAVSNSVAGLIYKNESGALSEGLSDIFGTLVEFYYDKNADWLMGEDIYTPGIDGDALRNVADPAKTKNPDHMSKKYNGSSDNGGVHTNCGIINKAGYLISEGGTHYGVTVTGIGKEKLGIIFYNALVNYVKDNETFTDFRRACIKTAEEKYGADSQGVLTLTSAFDAVGIK